MPRARDRAGAPARFLPMVLIGLAALALAAAALIVLRSNANPAAAAPPAAGGDAIAAPAAAASDPASRARSPQHTPVTAQDGVVRLSTAGLDDGLARFYTYQAGAKTIRFFVLKGSDGVVRAAFDACDVCYPAKKGYHQEGDVMVCNNCGTRFPSVRINVERGGCNPAPLEMRVQGDSVIIRAQDLQAGSRYF